MSKLPLLIGAHTSAAGGAFNALLQGQEIGATTIQFFTANQKRWESPQLTPEAINAWHETLEKTGMQQVMSHDSYLINLGSPDIGNLIKSRAAFREEIKRCLALKLAFLNFHPGAALTDTPEQCMDRICESVLDCEDLMQNTSLRLLLEMTAGQGSSVGYSFEQIAYMLHKLEGRIPIGICIDTCHIFVAGYDLRSTEACKATFAQFDKIVGLKHLYAMHLNDSMKDLGSRSDRHASLGKGFIGLDCFKFLMQDPRLQKIPKYLETPEGPDVWVQEIQMLREFAAAS